MKRPDCIRHWRELEGPDDATYPDSPERFSIGAPLGRGLRLNRLACCRNMWLQNFAKCLIIGRHCHLHNSFCFRID